MKTKTLRTQKAMGEDSDGHEVTDEEVIEVDEDEDPEDDANESSGEHAAESQSLPIVHVNAQDLCRLSDEHRTCAICTEAYQVGDNLQTLLCFHCFHQACIRRWLHRSNICPICRHDIRESNLPHDA